MENWVCPIDEDPPDFIEILKAEKNKNIVKNLKTISTNTEIKVFYLPGNHDMTVSEQIIEKNFPGMIFCGSALNNSVFRSGRLLAEHGSAHAFFNAPDPANSPGAMLPLGYFISRVFATQVARTGCSKRHYWKMIDDALEALGPQTLASSVFEAVMENANVSEDDEIKMYANRTVKTGEIKEKYSKLYKQWKYRHPKGKSYKAILAEIGQLESIADDLCKNNGTKIVVFGHSHGWKLDKDSFLVKDRIYVNCGTWCDDKRPKTFVQTEKRNGKHYVSVFSYNSPAQFEQLDEEYIKL